MKSSFSAILFFITVYFGTAAFADSVPPWMALVESKYKCDEKIVKESCVASIHGAGILIYVPPKEKDITTPHYYVMTDAHLSNGNFGSDSLKLFSRYNDRWLPLTPLKSGNKLARLSYNYYDLDIIEVEKPLGIPGESMFQYNYVESAEGEPNKSYFWVRDEINGKGYNEVLIAKDVFVVAPPALSSKPIEFQTKSEFPAMVSTEQMLRTLQEFIQGLVWTTFGEEFMTQSQIVNGMSGSPLLKRGQGELMVLGLSKRYHRFYNRSYFSTYQQLSNLFLDYNRRYFETITEESYSSRLSWSFLPFVGTFTKNVGLGMSEASYVSRNSGSFEISNSGDDRSWSLSKSLQEMNEISQGLSSVRPAQTVDKKRQSLPAKQLRKKDNFDSSSSRGGHDTSDGGAGSTVSLLNSDIKERLQLQPGMEYENKPIIGFSVTVSFSAKELTKTETFNIFANMEAYSYITGLVWNKSKEYTIEKMDVKPINPFVNLIDLFRNKVKNFPVIKDPFTADEELRRFGYYKNNLHDELVEQYIQQHTGYEVDLKVPICLINGRTYRGLTHGGHEQKIEIALLRDSKIEHRSKSSILTSYYSLELPLRLSWLQGFSQKNGSRSNREPEVIIDTKGLFLVNVADPVCRDVICPLLFDLNKVPYVTYKWKERSESGIATCNVLDNDSFFESLKSHRFTTEEL